jgi:hypothetical protein
LIRKSSSDLIRIRSLQLPWGGDGPRLPADRALTEQGSQFADLPGATKKLAGQKRRVNGEDLALVESLCRETAVEADALGFLGKMLVQTTLPHRPQPGNQYTRTDGAMTLSITDLAGIGLPYGVYPRLILVWMTTEAVRTGQRELELGRSLSSFMEQLGLQCTGGQWGTVPRFRAQMERLFSAAVSTRQNEFQSRQHHVAAVNLVLAENFDLWWTPQALPRLIPGRSSVTLSTGFFDQLIQSPVPLDLRAIRLLKRSPLSLDLYAWATRRVSYLRHPLPLSWGSFQSSFGADYANTPQGRSRFRANAIEALSRVKAVYPGLRIEIVKDGILLRPSLTHVPKTALK